MEKQVLDDRDEITLGELIRKVREWIDEVWRQKKLPIALALLGAAIMSYTWFSYTPVYPATITFSVDEDEAGAGGGLTSLLGQFGLGGVRPTRYNLDKILALSKSRRVIQDAFFKRVTIDGQTDYLANGLLREYKLDRIDDKEFRFTHDSLPAFGRDENDRLVALYELVVGPPEKPKKALVTADYNEDSNIMSLTAATTHEVLSFELAQGLFESLSNYYVNKAIEKQLKTYRIVSAKRDSVMTVLRSAEYQLASFKDRGRGLVFRTDQITEMRLQREITALAAIYTEVAKNTEVADFALRNKTPFIQVIDAPVYPLRPVVYSLPRKILIGLILGGFIGALVVIVRKTIREAIAQ
jgi:hypothetical protein